jgi:hypothetical protein
VLEISNGQISSPEAAATVDKVKSFSPGGGFFKAALGASAGC